MSDPLEGGSSDGSAPGAEAVVVDLPFELPLVEGELTVDDPLVEPLEPLACDGLDLTDPLGSRVGECRPADEATEVPLASAVP